MSDVIVDTTPVQVTPAGAAMNTMFAEGSVPNQVIVPPNAPASPSGAVTSPTEQPNPLNVNAYRQMLGEQAQPPALPQPQSPTEPVQPVAAAKPNVDMIPVARFQQALSQRNAEADRARSLEQQNAELIGYLRAMHAQQQQAQQPAEAQQPVPDHIADPIGYANYVQAQAEARANALLERQSLQMRQQMQELQQQGQMATMRASEAQARATYGQDAQRLISDATHAAVAAGLRDQFMASPDPVGNAIRWHQANQVQQTYGSDPRTVLQRAEQMLMKDPNFVARVVAQLRQGSQPPAVIPPPPGMMPRTGSVSPSGTLFQNGGSAVAAMLASR